MQDDRLFNVNDWPKGCRAAQPLAGNAVRRSSCRFNLLPYSKSTAKVCRYWYFGISGVFQKMFRGLHIWIRYSVFVFIFLEAFYFRSGIPASGYCRLSRRTMLLVCRTLKRFFSFV